MKRLTLLIFSMVLLLNTSLYSQKEDENLKEMFLDAEFFFMNEDYEEALSSYVKILRRGYEENGNINYRIGQCYLNIIGEKDKSIPYLEKAVQYANSKYEEGLFKEKYAPFDSYFYLGTAYRITNQLDKAIKKYEEFKTFYSSKDQERIALANKEIEACKYASEQMQNPVYIKQANLGKPISTASSDISPVVSEDMNSMVYITKQKFYDALFYCRLVNGKWTSPINITPEVQSDGDQYPTFLSKDGKELYLRKEDNFEADLLVSKNVDGVWTKSKSIGKNINSKFWEGYACTSTDGNTLYFSSNRKDGLGASDIYKSTRQPDGQWGIPSNLGKVVNTEFNEDAPYISEDGKRLYFISQGHKNMGGYDVFYSEILPDGQFSTPTHLDYPINTTDDDLYFYPVKNGKIAFTASSLKNGLGLEDIYALYLSEDAESLVMGIAAKDIKEVIPEPVKPLMDTTKKAVPAVIAQQPLVPASDSVKIAPPITVISAPIQPAKDTVKQIEQVIVAQEPVKEPEQIVKQAQQPVIAVNEPAPSLEPKPVESKNEESIVFRTLFFEFNSSELSANAKKELDHMLKVLKNYPDIKLQFTGHTDALGSNQYNQNLSLKRANAARNYLVKAGIESKRVLIKGMGENNFIALNTNSDGSDNAEGRKFNRRVDIKIVEIKQEGKIIIEELRIPKDLKIGQL